MKAYQIIALQKQYGNITLDEVIAILNRKYICPKCAGKGLEKVIVRYGSYGYSEDEYENRDCDICDGHGYTEKEMIPDVITKVVGYELK